MNDQPPKPFQFSVRGLLVFMAVISVVCFVLSLLVQVVRQVREKERSHYCINNLKEIGYALSSYHEFYSSFPPPITADSNGTPLHSWRLTILPFIEDTGLDDRYVYTLPWNHRNNLAVSSSYQHFICPSARNPKGSGFTNYVMVVGQERRDTSSQTQDHPDSIIVVEIANSDIHWTEPRDLNFDEMSFKINDKTKPSISSHHVHGAMVLYADGSVHFLDESADPEELKKLLTENLEGASGRGKKSE